MQHPRRQECELTRIRLATNNESSPITALQHQLRTSAALFAILLNFKHIYIYLALPYFVFLLRRHCWMPGKSKCQPIRPPMQNNWLTAFPLSSGNRPRHRAGHHRRRGLRHLFRTLCDRRRVLRTRPDLFPPLSVPAWLESRLLGRQRLGDLYRSGPCSRQVCVPHQSSHPDTFSLS